MDTANKIFAFGDSVMKGVIYDGTSYQVAHNNFISLCAKEISVNVRNYAKMGHTILDGIGIFHSNKSHISVGDSILIEYGGNDCDFNWQEISANPNRIHLPKVSLQGFIYSYMILLEDIKKLGARPILFSLPPISSKKYFNYFSNKMENSAKENIKKWLHGNIEFISQWHEQYNLAVFKIARDTDTKIIDISSCILSQTDYSDYICPDGIHPNERGHKLIANEIYKSITCNSNYL